MEGFFIGKKNVRMTARFYGIQKICDAGITLPAQPHPADCGEFENISAFIPILFYFRHDFGIF
ncbi:MAG: hypothetical protein ACI32F_05405 [Allobaculum sp.]